jgi:hypothetical protein
LDLTPFSNYNSFGIGVRDPYNHIDYLLDLPNLLKDKNEFISRLLFDKIDRVFVIITNRLGVATSVDGINWVERRYDPNQNYRCQGATNDAVLINTNWSQLNLYYLILSNKLLILDNFNSTEYRKIEFDTDVVASDSSNSKLYIFTNDDKISIYDSALNLIDSHSLDSDYESIYNSFHDTIDYSSIKFVTIDDNTLVMFNTSYIRSNYVVSYKDLEGNDIDPPRIVRESREVGKNLSLVEFNKYGVDTSERIIPNFTIDKDKYINLVSSIVNYNGLVYIPMYRESTIYGTDDYGNWYNKLLISIDIYSGTRLWDLNHQLNTLYSIELEPDPRAPDIVTDLEYDWSIANDFELTDEGLVTVGLYPIDEPPQIDYIPDNPPQYQKITIDYTLEGSSRVYLKLITNKGIVRDTIRLSSTGGGEPGSGSGSGGGSGGGWSPS